MELIAIGAIIVLVSRLLRRRQIEAAPPGIVDAVPWAATTRWAVVGPLARAEVRRVLLHPAFIAGLAITPVILSAATLSNAELSWLDAAGGTALGLVPLGWLTIIAANLVTLRPQRNGTVELLAAAPTPRPVRTAALLTTAIGPGIVTVVIAAAWMGYLDSRFDLRGSPSWSEAGAGVLIVAGAAVVGVAVARWLPNPVFGIGAVIAVILIQARFIDVSTWPWNRNQGDLLRFLGFLGEPTSIGAEFLEVRPAGWHLVYLAGWTVVMGGVALAHDGVHRLVWACLGLGALTATGSGIAQVQSLTDDALDRMVDALVDPESHQVCEVEGDVTYCAYPEFRDDIVDWQGTVRSTLAVLPPTVGTLEVRQRAATVIGASDCSPLRFTDALMPAVAARVSPAEIWPHDGMVHPPLRVEGFPCSDQDTRGFFLAVQTAAWATGLPPAPHHDDVRCTAPGQARSAVALWAATVSTPGGADTLVALLEQGVDDGSGLIRFTGWDSPPMWGVDYAVSDARAALALADLEPADLSDLIDGRWGDITAGSLSTSDLTDAAGVGEGGFVTSGRGALLCP